MKTQIIQNMKTGLAQRLAKSSSGRIAPALLLWFLGVPGGVVLLLWFFLWRGK